MNRLFLLSAIAAYACTVTAAPALRIPEQDVLIGDVHAVGVYEGTYPPGVGHGGGVHPLGKVTVKVAPGGRPKVLVLTSYEPVQWKIEAPAGAVVRVITSGYHKQEVVGLPEQTPVKRLSHAAGDEDYFFAYREAADPNDDEHEKREAKERYEQFVERVKKLAGAAPHHFQGSYQGEKFEVK